MQAKFIFFYLFIHLFIYLFFASHCNALIGLRDHSGHYPVQYLRNIQPAAEQCDWLILAIGPLELVVQSTIKLIQD